jgi:hypothetical protein
MRVSDSGPSETTRVTARSLAPYAIAAAYFAAHLPFLAPSLEDIDSINFALGLHHFDPALHQPHPPGYPIYIALGRLSLAVLHAVVPSLDAARTDALALAFWSAVGGAIAVVAAACLFESVSRDLPRRVAWWATALLAASPLFWMCGLRPMSDMPGLAAALSAQALLVRGMRDRRALVAGALMAAIALGLRLQTLWLTAPLMLLALIAQREAGAWWLLSRPIAAAAAGVLAWAIPLIVASGGVDAYIRALGSQAGEDFAWVSMVWASPTPRNVAVALYNSIVLPFERVGLARVIDVAAAVGALVLLLRDRRALLLIAVAFLPYAVFHLLFQETVTVRYALPLIPPISYLAATAVAFPRRLAPVLATPVLAFSLVLAIPAAVAYGREAHPAFRAIADMVRAVPTDRPAGVYAHYSLRRPLQTLAAAALPVVEPRRSYEWMGPVDYWRRGGTAPIWFLADPRRTDLELIDPQARRNVRHYSWIVGARNTLGGTRPLDADWYRLERPGWFVTEGWSLTPEAGGITVATASGPDHRPIEAFVRRRSGAAYVMVGGRHLGAPTDPAATFDLALDGRPLESWTLDPAKGLNFLRVIELRDGIPAGDGDYARLTIAARAATPGTPTPPVAIRQFDVQPATGMIHAFADGWYEDEYDNATGRRWRWTSERAALRIVPPQAVRLTLRGESPVKYFHAVPTVRIAAGGRVVSELHPDRDFRWQVTVPAADVLRSNGLLTVETDRVYLPGPAEGTADRRRLGLRLYEIRVDTVLP